MDLLRCDDIRPLVPAHYDGELSVDDQIVVEDHLAGCAGCAGEARRLRAIGQALRARALRLRSRSDDLAGLATTVISRLTAERDLSVCSHARRLFEDSRFVWTAAGVAAVSLVCVVLTATALQAVASQRTDSLSAIMRALGDPGSNANPRALGRGVALPRLEPQAGLPPLLSGRPLVTDQDALALMAVVTQDGRVAQLRVLRSPTEVDPDWLDVMSAARFVPASYAGAPVAVNLVWVLERTTVRGDGPGQS